MMMDHTELSNIMVKLGKKLGIKPNEKITIDELCKKIINRDLNYVTERKEFDLGEPSLAAAFFINNIDVLCDNELIKVLDKDFDLDLLMKIKQVNSKEYELIDYNKRKVRVPIETVTICTKNNIPLELLLKIM